MENKQQTIKDYIVNEMYFSENADTLSYETPLLGDVIDSLGLQMLIPFLETEFGLNIPDEELVPENFNTINSITKLIDRIKSHVGC